MVNVYSLRGSVENVENTTARGRNMKGVEKIIHRNHKRL